MNKIIRLDEGKNEFEEREKEKLEVYQILEESRESLTKKKKKTIAVQVVGKKINQNLKTPEVQICAACRYGNWTIYVPAVYMGFSEDVSGMSDEDKRNKYSEYIKKMTMATIDVVILKIDYQNMTAIGNRAIAMEDKVERNYFRSDKNGKSRMERAFMQENLVEARVITLTRSTVIVDIYGYITHIIARNVEWRYVARMSDVVTVGDKVPVKILRLAIDKENKLIDMEVSIKDAKENISFRNMSRYTIGSSEMGIISEVKNGYFVQVGDYEHGIDVFCKNYNRRNISEPPSKGDTVLVDIKIKDETKGRVYGEIDQVLKRNKYVA